MQLANSQAPVTGIVTKIVIAVLMIVVLAVWPGLLHVNIETATFGLFSSEPWQTFQYDDSGQAVRVYYSPLAIGGGLGLVLVAFYGVAAGLANLIPALKAAGSGATESTSQKVVETGAKLDSELAAILTFIRGYLGANEAYAKSLVEANKKLPASVSSAQVQVIVKFLMTENEKMQREAGTLKKSLESSQSQIEKLRASLSAAEELSVRDELTALLNRRGFDMQLASTLQKAQTSGKPLCLAMSDIDHFKKVNDTFGHLVGDEILKMFSGLLSASVTEKDVVARYGGEEFAIVLPETTLDEARQIVEKIRTKFEAKKLAVNKSGQMIGKVTASFGLAQFSEGDTPRTLVWRADAKLYEAKSGGRNRVAVCDQKAS